MQEQYIIQQETWWGDYVIELGLGGILLLGGFYLMLRFLFKFLKEKSLGPVASGILKDTIDKQTVKIDNLGREVSALYTREDIDRKFNNVYDTMERRQNTRTGE